MLHFRVPRCEVVGPTIPRLWGWAAAASASAAVDWRSPFASLFLLERNVFRSSSRIPCCADFQFCICSETSTTTNSHLNLRRDAATQHGGHFRSTLTDGKVAELLLFLPLSRHNMVGLACLVGSRRACQKPRQCGPDSSQRFETCISLHLLDDPSPHPTFAAAWDDTREKSGAFCNSE